MPDATYIETFDNGSGGWIAWHGHGQPAPAEVVDNALISRSPWGIDSNHAPPGAGYLHLLFILATTPHVDPSSPYTRLMTGNRFIEEGHSRDLRNARLTARLKGEADLKGAKLLFHCQAQVGDKAINFVLADQPFEVTPEWTEQTITLTTDPGPWLCLGARHDAVDFYGWGDIQDVLRDVNVGLILLLHPLTIVPMTPQPHGPHHRKPEVDYPVDRTALPQGWIMLDEVRIDYGEVARTNH